jgi:CRISPR-associated protein Cas2
VLTWVVYDIADDRRRERAARASLQAGLVRVQQSVFLGTLADTQRDELVVALGSLIDPEYDSAYVFPMCRPDFAKVALLGRAFDRRRVTDELRTLVV